MLLGEHCDTILNALSDGRLIHMPLDHRCSVDAFKRNIETEVKAGKKRDQAVAIAFSTLRRACGAPEDGSKLSPDEIVRKYGGKEKESENRRPLFSYLFDYARKFA